jgi:hypothetical protein
MSALKLTFPTPLPKNEKDLICMLLAGRLKDLFKGRLVCAQLAIDDLLKDLTGVSALGSLQTALLGMKGALDGFKAVSGYNNILNGVNKALGQVNNVFSLGGLCPSPVHAPKIPDLLGQLGTNLFGQGLNILNALGRLSNPSMCLGGKPPKGFGINWNSMPGDLKNLKAAIAQFKNDPAGADATIKAFVRNLEAQTSSMKAEIKRLEKNLADPLGLNDKLNTARNIQRVKSISDGYPVKDARGIIHSNVLKSMVPADIESVIDNASITDKTPIKYVTRAVVDYCGDVVGYEKVAVTGDTAYIGWDPNNDAVNTDNPTVNPVAGYLNYTYLFKQEGSNINVYDDTGTIVTDLKLSRGFAYRLGFELINKEIKFYSDSACTTVWTEGLTYSKSPEYGTDIEVILPDVDTSFVRGELDWAVLIENPTTPNIVYWKADSVNKGSFTVDGITELPEADKTYDISMAVKKACLHLVTVPASGLAPNYENFNGNALTSTTTRTYNTTTNIYNSSGTSIGSQTLNGISFIVKEDIETSDELGNTDPNNKIIKSSVKLPDNTYLITKRYVSIENGLEYNQLAFYISPNTDEENATSCILLKFDDPITILNSSKLPFTDYYSYKLTILDKVGNEFEPRATPISNSNETKFTLYESGSNTFIRWNLTNYSEADKAIVPKNEFIFQTDIKIDPTDPGRTFISTDPIEYRTYFYFKLPDSTAFDMTLTSVGSDS